MRVLNAKYKVGSSVFAKVIPDEHLIVQRFVGYMYYCKLADDSDDSELVYFEKELMSSEEKKRYS